uniref:Calcium-independent phospholipase A2-gamma n=1 Tax=Kryptolebias marmoratus TaxID=37003 RepID=A0A3Q3BFT2_KRYMA
MSRLRSTIDSVTKAVGSTDLISKFSRFKPANATADGAHAGKVLIKAETLTGDVASKPPSNTAMEEKADGEKNGAAEEAEKSSSLASAASVAVPSSSSAVEKQTIQLFHPGALSANMDETYKSLSHHINSYFGTNAQEENAENRQQHLKDKSSLVSESHITALRSEDHVPVLSPASETKSIEAPTPSLVPSSPEAESPPSSGSTTRSVPEPKKGFTQYLSYPRPSVQAFVGSYIAPLVPKFRGDSKRVAADKDKSPVVTLDDPTEDGAAKRAESDEEKAAKAKQQLLSQREKIIARVSVDNRTRALVKGVQRVTDVKLLTTRVEELSFHLLDFPETRGVAIKESVLPCLLRLRQARDVPLQAAVREALAVVGYTDPVRGKGIRVLAIDGGGTGLLALQTLHKLQDLTGKPIHQLFDYICGVSTAILAFMLGIFQIPLEECEDMYKKLGSDVFKQNVIVGTVKMGWSHAFYDSEIWENLLVSAVSTIVNRGLPLKAYVFRNYRLMPGVRSHYLGDCKHKMWQAIRASSAAPGYFQEFVLGKDLHQDGGLLINNPTALAIHECKCLWPNAPLQCVLSLGTGRYETAGKNSTAYTSLKTKLSHIISSATDTEVHTMLDALLPPDTYFRFNPYMSEDVPLNESRIEKLDFLKSEAERYLERNEAKLRKAASVLGQEKGAMQRLAEWAKLKADMYEGVPFASKL